jgi:catechol 2,3-dioxygenase-like lactoylglutathione lyase family enzyme
MQPRLVHVAIKVDDLERSSAFYEQVFGFHRTGISRSSETNAHTSLHLSDGTSDLALMRYDSEQAPEADLAGPGPCIHHIGIRVDDPLAWVERLRGAGCEILSPPGEVPVKFRDPGGVVAEIGPFVNYVKPRPA